MRYPQASTLVSTDIVLDRDFIIDAAGGMVAGEGTEELTFRTVLNVGTNTLTMQVLADGRIVGERGVYTGVPPTIGKDGVQGEGTVSGQ